VNFGETIAYTPVAYWDKPHGDTVARIVSMYLHSIQTPLEAASAQWAIWEIMANEGNNLAAGGVRINASQSSIVARGTAYLTQYNGYTPASVQFMESPTRQDMVAFDSTSAIPEVTPNAALLFAIAISSLTYRRRSR